MRYLALDVGPGETLNDYLSRRAELGLSCAPDAVLITDDEGAPIPAGQLDTYYQVARTGPFQAYTLRV